MWLLNIGMSPAILPSHIFHSSFLSIKCRFRAVRYKSYVRWTVILGLTRREYLEIIPTKLSSIWQLSTIKPTKCLTLLLQNAKRVMEHVGFTMYRISRLSLVEAQFRKPLVAAQVQAAMLWNSCSLVCRKPGVEGLHSYAAWNCDRWACKWSRLIVQVRKRSRLCSEAVPCPSLKCKKGCRKIIFPKCKAQNNLLRAHSRPNRITGWQSRQLKAKIPMFHDFSLKSMNLDFGKITGFLP